ncbi:unnamed protein product, partial [Adineta ricciae]
TGEPARNCHECPDAPQCGTNDFLDISRCPIHSCNTTCLVSDTFDDPLTGEQCYQSQCAPAYLDNDLTGFFGGKYRIDIEAIVYLAQDRSKYYLWEMDVYCGAYN